MESKGSGCMRVWGKITTHVGKKARQMTVRRESSRRKEAEYVWKGCNSVLQWQENICQLRYLSHANIWHENICRPSFSARAHLFVPLDAMQHQARKPLHRLRAALDNHDIVLLPEDGAPGQLELLGVDVHLVLWSGWGMSVKKKRRGEDYDENGG